MTRKAACITMTLKSYDFKVICAWSVILLPKQTFFNLSQEKRQKIEQAALDEFSEYGFDNSNMNRIVAQSEIAKSSFYQYFEDKKDLYFHLIDTLVARKIVLLERVLSTYRLNPFSHNLEEIFSLGLEFADTDPKFYLLGEDFSNKPPSFTREFFQKYTPTGIDIYGQLLEHARETDELCEGINIPLVSSFINSLINQTSVGLIRQVSKERRNFVISELVNFIERAVIKPHGK